MPGFRMLGQPRVTVKADSLLSVFDKYELLKDIWEESYSEFRETGIRARIKVLMYR